jgi:uncharacterized membrane protein YuzA (DUF378 family)
MNPEMQTFLAWLNFLTLGFVALGALNWGFFAFGINIFADLSFGIPSIEFAIYMVIAISAALHIFSRDFTRPFLGSSVYPCGSLISKTPEGADSSIAVRVQPNSNVVFWASEKITHPLQAYSEFSNAGVTRADASGNAVLSVRHHGVHGKRAFVHYRTCDGARMLGPVKSVALG